MGTAGRNDLRPWDDEARAFQGGGTVTQISDVYGGSLDEVLAVPQPPADPEAVAALTRYLARPPDAAPG